MKRDQKNKVFALFIIITFIGSGFAYAIISAFSFDSSKKSILNLNIDGSQQQIQLSFTDEQKLGDALKLHSIEFNRTCFNQFCNNENSSVGFYVNFERNEEYENYILKEGDTLLIEYK